MPINTIFQLASESPQRLSGAGPYQRGRRIQLLPVGRRENRSFNGQYLSTAIRRHVLVCLAQLVLGKSLYAALNCIIYHEDKPHPRPAPAARGAGPDAGLPGR